MMDELKQQFYEVMHKYQKPFSEEGVTANLTQWYEQKQGLLQFLRRHPLWNEKELAIVFRVEERREIDRITVDETRAAILELGRRACTDDTVYENFETALRAATRTVTPSSSAARQRSCPSRPSRPWTLPASSSMPCAVTMTSVRWSWWTLRTCTAKRRKGNK